MAAESEVLKPAQVIPIEQKQEPRSKGITTPRKKKTERASSHHRVLHGLRGLSGLCRILPC